MNWSDAFVPYGGGRKAPVGGLADEALLETLRNYKRQIAKRYRVIDASQMERILPAGNLWISPKLDGELWFLVKRGDDLALCAHNGRVIHGIPMLQDIAKRVTDAPDFVIAGELVAAIGAGRPRSPQLATAFADEQYVSNLAFHAFDLVADGDTDALGTAYVQRIEQLQSWLSEAGTVATVVGDAAAAGSHYREWVAAGNHEGLVVRSEQNVTYKIKPHFTIDVVVVAYGVRLVGEVRQLRELAVALVRDDGTLQLLGTVGGGFSEEERITWLARLEKLESDSSFRMANSEGTLSRFVRPELIIEVRCSDLLVSDSEDRPIRRMALSWDAERGYQPIGEQVTAVMLHPAFLRERTDKRVDAGDVGQGQVTSRVQFEDERSEAAPSEATGIIVERKVWTKETKGLVAVRKYALIETQRDGRDYPPFVLFMTDYSPGRADPLQTALRSAGSRDVAQLQIAAWIEENIKKGWNEVGGDAAA
ncbi:MAG: ATP-dependent DNA ligase [Burkholderiaceae bacterium]|nr:ATP-dependent DNA ligase [Burkholderiaceae bacterium]